MSFPERGGRTVAASALVVAHITALSDELLAALRSRAEEGAVTFTLLVPAKSAGREGRQAARERLDEALEHLRGAGLEAEGRVGPPDPVAAVDGVWDPGRFDEIIVSTLPTGASKWLQIDLPHRIERLTGVPVTHVVASEPRESPAGVPAPERERLGILSPFAPLTWGRQEDEEGGSTR